MIFLLGFLFSVGFALDDIASLIEEGCNAPGVVARAGKSSCPEYHGPAMVMKAAAPELFKFKIQSIASTGGYAFPVSVVPEADLAKVYRKISDMGLPWANPTFCRDRALAMASLFNQSGIKVGQVISAPKIGSEIVPNYKDQRANLRWKYHQAVFVMVQKANGSIEKEVIDPATFDHATPLKEWQAFQQNLGTTYIGGPTALNAAEASLPNPPPLDITVSGNQAICRIRHFKDGTPCT